MESSPITEGVRPRSCWLEINLDRVINNLSVIKQEISQNSQILAVVKAEAYGHGAEMIARTLSNNGVKHFGVATLEEALKLREFGIEDDILIMGHMATFNVEAMIKNNLSPFLFSFRLLKALNKEARRRNTVAPFHLKVDTGMGRLGILPKDLGEFLEEIQNCDHVKLEGVATHLAVAGENENYTNEQLEEFGRIKRFILKNGFEPNFWHVMNSAAVFSSEKHIGNLVRPGITIYGYPPFSELEVPELQPVMQVKTKMADFKKLPPKKGISYGRIYSPSGYQWIGVLPIGYADGYFRSLTGNAYILKHGRPCPVLGSICMDMTVIGLDEGDDPEETVIIMGEDATEEIWADQLAEWANTIPYEILSNFSDRLPRLYFHNDEPVAIKSEQGVSELSEKTRDDLSLESQPR